PLLLDAAAGGERGGAALAGAAVDAGALHPVELERRAGVARHRRERRRGVVRPGKLGRRPRGRALLHVPCLSIYLHASLSSAGQRSAEGAVRWLPGGARRGRPDVSGTALTSVS